MRDSFLKEAKVKYTNIFAEWNREGISEDNPILLFNCYLILTELYYNREASYVEDAVFDLLCKKLLSTGKEKMKERGVWWVDELYDESALRAGTGFHTTNKIPLVILNICDVIHVGRK